MLILSCTFKASQDTQLETCEVLSELPASPTAFHIRPRSPLLLQTHHTRAHLIDFTCAVPSLWNSFPLAPPCWLLHFLRSQLICRLFVDRPALSLTALDTSSSSLVYLQCRLPLSNMRAFNLSMLFTTVSRGSSPELQNTENKLVPLQIHRRDVTSLWTVNALGHSGLILQNSG